MKIHIAVIFLFCCAAQLFGTTVTVSTTAQLLSAVQTAANGDTVQMSNGTYTIVDNGSGIGLSITKSIVLKSINGAAAVTITASTSYIAIQVNASNVTVDGITIGGAQWGVQATAVSGVLLRNLVVSTVSTGGHSLGFQGTTNSVIERCTANNSYNHGISLSTGANNNLIIANTIQGTQTGDGIAVVTSDRNVISGNTINNTFFDAVTLNGSQYNYVALNKINSPHNGVTVTKDSPPAGRQSIGNYVGNNTMVLNPANGAGGSDGLWFNYDSNYNMAFGNDASSSQENAMAIFNSVGNYIRGNVFHNNPQGGIFVWNSNGSSGTTPPNFNSIQQNYLHHHAANGGVTLDNAGNTDVSFNYMAGDPAQIAIPIAGFLARTGVTNTTVTSNVIRDLLQGEQIDASASGISLFLNRHFNTPNHYTFLGATVNWDSGSAALGGNFFSDFLSANGNPSNGSTPFSNIIYDNQAHTGVYKDNFPYQSESLGRQYLISATLPSASASLPIGTLKTISWNSQACVLVDLTLLGSSSSTPIATNAADYGYFRWTVPNVAVGSYTVRIDCKDSTGSPVRATSTTAHFNILPPDLVLLSPQTNQMLDSSSTMVVSWSKTANVTLPVDVYYSTGNGLTLLQSGVTADFVRVPVPATGTNSITVAILSGSYGDSTDGAFTVRDPSLGAFTAPAQDSSILFVGSPYPVEWYSTNATAYVDIDLISGSTTRNIVTKLADFSKYLMTVPALPGAGAFLRITFHGASGSVINTAQSVAFNIASAPAQPVTITTLSGSPQTNGANGVFTTPLQAVVRDANSNPVPGVTVTFTTPSTGAGAIFNPFTCHQTPCPTTIVATTDASGIATPPFGVVSNGTNGSYVVTATSPSASGVANFNLTNTSAVPPTADSVSPSSGTGAAQTFSALYSDIAGFGVLNRRLFLINSSLSGAGACYVQVDPTGIYLVNDAGNGLLGPITGSATLTNTQCTLNGVGTGVVNSGTGSTVTLSLTFKPVFNGAKNIYMYADDNNGLNSGFQTRGTFTVNVTGVPAAVSVSPSSGSGTSQTFTATYSDTAGAGALNRRLFLINSALNGANACYIQADANGIFLVNNAGNALQPANSLSNSQCTVNGPGSTVVNSGNTSTVTLAIAFAPSFAGAKTIFMYTEDASANTGFVSRGSFTVLAAASVPTTVSVTPSAASGAAQTFTAVYSDAAGANNLNRRLFLINSSLNGSGACFVQTDPSGIYLVNDAGSGLLGPVTGGTTQTNSQCTLNGTGTGNVNSGNTSTVTISLTFKAPFSGAKNIYMFADDAFGNSSAFQARGTYTVALGVPTADSVTPSNGSGTTQTFTAVYSDGAGAAILNRRLFLINSSLSGANACFVQADQSGVYLVTDAGNALLGPVTAGTTQTNTQCTLNGTGTGVVNSGNTSTVTISIAFKPSFTGMKNIYMYADDTNGNNSGFQTRGTFINAATPTNTSVTPNSGSGTQRTFTVVYSDASGNAQLNRRLFLINSSLNGANACFVETDPNGIFLATDAGNALTGPLPPNSNLANTQCQINVGASVSYSATSTTVVLPITFRPPFNGTRNIYMYVEDVNGINSGWQQMGTITTQ